MVSERLFDPEKYMKTNDFRGDGAVLRYIAVATMFIDHAALCLVDHIPQALYSAGRGIGRISYPIFAYCLVCGYKHTRDVRRYAARVAIAALCSEIPYDIMIRNTVCYMPAQNVMWTMLIGLGMLWGCDRIRLRGPDGRNATATICPGEKKETPGGSAALARRIYEEHIRWLLLGTGKLAVMAIACLTAQLVRADYGWEGIAFIAGLSLLPQSLYDIPRGNYPKYLFYAFYPVHMLLLSIVRYALQ